jgi:hypothetical protein
MQPSLKYAIASCLAVSVVGVSYWAGTQSTKQVSVESIKNKPVTPTVATNTSPAVKNDSPFPTYNLGSFTGTKHWENDVSTEEVHFKIKLTSNQELLVRGTPIHAIELKDAHGNTVECVASETDDCDSFSIPTTSPYVITLTYRLGSGYDENDNAVTDNRIRSNVKFTVTDKQRSQYIHSQGTNESSKTDEHLKKVGACFATVSSKVKRGETVSPESLALAKKYQGDIDRVISNAAVCKNEDGQQFNDCLSQNLSSPDLSIYMGMSEATKFVNATARPGMLPNAETAMLAYCLTLD